MSRTKEQLKAAKKLLKKPAGKFEQINLNGRTIPSGMTRAFNNNRYVVMIFDNSILKLPFTRNEIGATKVMVQRHDDKPIPDHWREMQNIKNELFGRNETAIEVFPPEGELVDKANIYWMWIFH